MGGGGGFNISCVDKMNAGKQMKQITSVHINIVTLVVTLVMLKLEAGRAVFHSCGGAEDKPFHYGHS